MEAEIMKELGIDLPKDKNRNILIDFYDNQCHTTFSGYWDGKMIKAALRSIERQYAATKHMMTRDAAAKRMAASLVKGGSEDGR